MAKRTTSRRRKPATANPSEVDSTDVRRIQLEAIVPNTGEAYLMGTDEAMDLFRLTDARALRKWHTQGLPYRREDRNRIVYPLPDAHVWFRVREYLKRRNKWRGDTHLDMDRAFRIDLWLQSTCPVSREPVVSVPLYRDHPMRAHFLRIAAAGIEPPATEGPATAEPDDLDTWEPTPRRPS